jgi:hypothetical protein
MKKTMDQKYMSTIASNSLPIDTEYMDKKTATKVFATPSNDMPKNLVKSRKKSKTQRKRKLTLKRRKVR